MFVIKFSFCFLLLFVFPHKMDRIGTWKFLLLMVRNNFNDILNDQREKWLRQKRPDLAQFCYIGPAANRFKILFCFVLFLKPDFRPMPCSSYLSLYCHILCKAFLKNTVKTTMSKVLFLKFWEKLYSMFRLRNHVTPDTS